MELTEERLGEHGIRHESLLFFLSPPQSGVMFRAKGEGHSWLLLSPHRKASIYKEDVKVAACTSSSFFPPLCIQNVFKRQRRGRRGGRKRDVRAKEEENLHFWISPPCSSTSCPHSSLRNKKL